MKTFEFAFSVGQNVRLWNEKRKRTVTSRHAKDDGTEWYRLNYGGHWYGGDELRVYFGDNRDVEE